MDALIFRDIDSSSSLEFGIYIVFSSLSPDFLSSLQVISLGK